MELELLDGVDVVIGSRYVDGINVVNWPLGRILLSLAASYYVKFFTNLADPLQESNVVTKSYPDFWNDLEVNFEIFLRQSDCF